MDEIGRRLADGITALNIPFTPEQHEKLLAFLRLIQKWNRVYNLTAIRDLRTGVDLHLLDSLTIWPYLRGERILDVGTGAGLPGIPLAVMSESRHFVLLDSNAKKTRFVQQAVIELGLANVEVVTSRVEDYHPDHGFDTILARAYASLAEIMETTRRMLAPHGVILAQKGQFPEGEIQTLKDSPVKSHRLKIPGLDVERHLIEIAIG
ncbi:16S rRNA (guanine(527)-N(7))-methyltransferase RsmG [Methylocaldum sp.]|uniref:16S rRNA (guanine(527)-N(7))-methyltransferase RsmG n=1 Tax=unclassified Methylocaldum TaxID=2622260 RepID=UPI0032209329